MEDFNTFEPKTERELLIVLSGKIGELASSIDRIAETINTIENKRIEPLVKRVEDLEKFNNKMSGGWMYLIVATAVLAFINTIKSFLIN